MRIYPRIAAYHEMCRTVFLELPRWQIATPEEARAFLEPYSPPAPPPQVPSSGRAPNAARGQAEGDSFDDEPEDHLEVDEDLDDLGGDDDDLGLDLPFQGRFGR